MDMEKFFKDNCLCTKNIIDYTRELKITKSNNDWYLEVYDLQQGKMVKRIYIDYCPLCGKKLG